MGGGVGNKREHFLPLFTLTPTLFLSEKARARDAPHKKTRESRTAHTYAHTPPGEDLQELLTAAGRKRLDSLTFWRKGKQDGQEKRGKRRNRDLYKPISELKMKSWTSHSLWRITSVLLIQVTLLCSAGGESRDLDYPDQVLSGRFILQPRELHGNDYRRQLAITREARSENNPRLMSIDLSALARHPLGPGIGSSGFARPSKLMAIDLSVLSRNPDPRLPLIQLPFPDPWDIGMKDPIFPGRARSPFHPPPLAESKNTMQDSMDIFGETREEKKQAEPNTESNSIPIFGEHSSPFRRTSEDRRTFRRTDPEGEEDLINNVRLPHRKRDGRQLEIKRDPRLTPALLLRNLSLRSRELQPAATSAQDAADSQYSFDDRDYLNKLDYTE